MSSKVSVPDPTWPRGQRQTRQPQRHQTHIHDTLQQMGQNSLGQAERRRQSDRPHPGSHAGSAGRPEGQLGAKHSLRSPQILFHSFQALNAQPLSPLLTSSQQPAVIEPGALIIGVREEGVLHQLQFCRGQGGTGYGHPRVRPSPWSTASPQLHSSVGPAQWLHLSHWTLEFRAARG